MTLSLSGVSDVIAIEGIPFELNDISNKEWEEIKTMAMRLKRIFIMELVLTIYLKMV